MSTPAAGTDADAASNPNPNPTTGSAPRLPPPLDAVKRAWADWLATLAGLPDDRLTEPVVGAWSVKDLLGHVAFWDGWATRHAQDFLDGQPKATYDWQAMNDAEAAAGANRTTSQQHELMTVAHAELLDVLAGLSPDTTDLAALHDRIRGCATDHYAEHAAEVRAWRTRQSL